MSDLKVRDLSPAFGAEIEGLVPAMPLDDATLAELRQLFLDRSLLVFPDLDIDEAFQRYLVFALIGQDPPEVVRPEPFFVSNRAENGGAPYGRLLFHCDTMWADTQQPLLSLYGAEVGQPSVPTMFVSMADGWDRLPDELRSRIEGREARHGHEDAYPNRGGDDDVIDAQFDAPQSVVRPVAFPHEDSGRMVLYVSQQVTMEILGLAPEENEELLEALFEHLYVEESIVRHDWRTGDLVIWDNRALQHARGNVNLDGPERTLRKVTGPLDLSASSHHAPSFSRLGAS